jgi:hypothetical protein
MAINDQELEQKLKDLDRAIELGETEEDMDQLDQESGIRSLRKAPSIKMASETPGEEFELEIKMMIKEFEDAVRDGYKGSFEDFANYYFSQKEMMKDRTMAMMGGRMKYAAGDERPYEMKGGQKKFIDLPEKGYSTPFEAREAGDLEDRARYREIQSVKDKKGKPKPFKMDTDKIEALIKAAKEEKLKKAKGGVASILGD